MKRNLLTLKIIVIVLFFFTACSSGLPEAEPASKMDATQISDETNSTLPESAAENEVDSSIFPAGLCAKTQSSDSVICLNASGQELKTLQVPGIGGSDPQKTHIAGKLSDGADVPPVVYYVWDPVQALLLAANSTVTTIKNTNAFLALAGAPARQVLAYSEITYEGSEPHSFLFAGTPQSLASAEPFFDLKGGMLGMVILPVSVEAVGEQAQKVWYAQTAWGIGGGDIIFPINRGLYVYDLLSDQNYQGLGSERNFQGLSPDNSLAGSTASDFAGDQSMRINNLETGQIVNFPLNPSSDRGAGYAVFSYDGKLTAWLEASGSMVGEPPNFRSRVRIGDIAASAVVGEVESVQVAQALGWGRVSFMKPVGWLDDQVVVIEARGPDWENAVLVMFDTLTKNLTLLCQGSFLGFIYS